MNEDKKPRKKKEVDETKKVEKEKKSVSSKRTTKKKVETTKEKKVGRPRKKKEVENIEEINHIEPKKEVIGQEAINPKSVQKKKSTFSLVEILVLVFVTSFVSVLMGAFVTHALMKDKNIYDQEQFSDELKEFIENYHYIKENYDSVTEKQLLNGAIGGMLEATQDPYATFMDDEETERELEGQFTGMGVQIYNNEDGNIEILTVFENSPAKEAGLMEGDIITKIDDLDLKGQISSALSTYVQGSKKKDFHITYLRDGNTLEVDVTKRMVEIPSVISEKFEENGKNVGYLGISIFSATTTSQFQRKLKELESNGIDALIIDVRGNSGGRLDSVVGILSTLLDSSHVIYKTDTKGKIETFYSKGSTTKKYKIVVLTNGGSASASEILASALQEEYKATLVGTKTYGKGTVQQVRTLQNGDEYKLTTKKWLTPSSKWVDGVGVTPDEEVILSEEYYQNPSDETDNQLKRAIEILTK